jgi:hypothetical protein
MRLIRPALALALASTVLVLAMPSGGSAATLPTPTRIVLFKGGDATPVGPAVQPAGKWTVSTAPAKITTTNYGTLVEDTGLGTIGACAAKCGEWWYDPRPSAVQLQEFYWDETNGQRVLATNLGPALANNSEWASLGNGTYAPLCLSWLVTAHNIATPYYIKLNLKTHGWSKISSAQLSTCLPAGTVHSPAVSPASQRSRSPGWHLSTSQSAASVVKRTALARPFLSTARLAVVIPTRSASSPTDIFRLASITSMSTAIAIRSPRPDRPASAPLRRRGRRPGRAASAARAR